ncbi:hypothetical protein [Desulfococcus multivorans]|uniref:Uncharacterized protein n=2 Tax=Desulfococcus multivorans TaxID=897 RepID=S7VFT9_DESML|nr:hypothetical protein [Desulfococcus multivorans]AQV00858.2 hypothetical protein B2D07_08805 [Desulfococcus multivorans]EPR43333.1 hypothetical protein dsmv_1359 [Desulfococcus multivorans DSM 2059]SJZ43141.1 hypothetical protein SAMN02745446_00475 [Desulfococcus multivorans DSM 2059]
METTGPMISPEDTQSSTTRMVVAALMTGVALKARDVAASISRSTGRDVTPAGISGILSRISDPSRSDLGNFIQKHKAGNAWVYTLSPAAKPLSEAQAYDLTQKTGADRYTLAQALRDYPALRRKIAGEVRPEVPKAAFRMVRKLADSVRPGRRIDFTARKAPRPSDHTVELSIQYSSRYVLSMAASLRTFILLCLAAVLAVGAACLFVYVFLFPALVLVSVAVIAWLGRQYFRRSREIR